MYYRSNEGVIAEVCNVSSSLNTGSGYQPVDSKTSSQSAGTPDLDEDEEAARPKVHMFQRTLHPGFLLVTQTSDFLPPSHWILIMIAGRLALRWRTGVAVDVQPRDVMEVKCSFEGDTMVNSTKKVLMAQPEEIFTAPQGYLGIK